MYFIRSYFAPSTPALPENWFAESLPSRTRPGAPRAWRRWGDRYFLESLPDYLSILFKC
jgi:hypothetical protein